MPFATRNDALDRRLTAELLGIADPPLAAGTLLNAVARIREAIFHDFSNYRFLLPPSYLSGGGGGPKLPGTAIPHDGHDVAMATWIGFEAFVDRFDTDVRAVVADWVVREVTEEIHREAFTYAGLVTWYDSRREREERISQVALVARDGFRIGLAPDIFHIYTATDRKDLCLLTAQEATAAWLAQALRALVRDDGVYEYHRIMSVQTSAFWEAGRAPVLAALAGFQPADPDADDPDGGVPEFGEDLPDSYAFDPFRPGTVNFGLQIVYRQGWIPLGTQPGEIVRTLPLGPKQTEKITVKAVRRTKATRQTEIASSIETATESSAATKDSSEVVQEASESFNWHAEATASASFGFGSGSVTAGAGGENAASSSDSKSRLNETMEKTASKIRKDTKIVVTTEVEETSEFSQVSEITNPNDEVAVTYIYSRLQRQYELRTYLSQVNQVIFVAEPIPAPDDITGSWIRRYDWIIARELLDESLRADLDIVRNHDTEGQPEPEDPRITGLMQSISGDGRSTGPGVPDYRSLSGTIPDLFRQQQEAYEREVNRRRARVADRAQYLRGLRRLRAHLYDNILHYCRAIWSQEDPDARLLRYRKIRVPIRWEFVTTGSGPHSSLGYFTPSVTDIARDTVPLADLVNPVGPIGFAGNYAAFYLRQSTRWSGLLDMLRMMQAPYTRFDIDIDRDGIDAAVGLHAAVSDHVAVPGRNRLTRITSAEGLPQLSVEELRDGEAWVHIRDITIREGGAIVFLGVKLRMSGIAALNAGDRFEIALVPQPVLEDPELKALRWTVPPLDPAAAPDFFTPEVVAAVRENFSDVYRAYEGADAETGWAESDATQRTLLLARYFDYLLRRRHTRRILLDTNNLMLTREVDRSSTLEPYKGLHRALDVLSVNEELRQRVLETERRRARLDADLLGDPEIDKLTVVATEPGAAGLAALDQLQGDGDGNPGDGG